MGKKTLILLGFFLLLLAPGLAISDCADFTRMTSWAVQEGQTIVFFCRKYPFCEDRSKGLHRGFVIEHSHYERLYL